MRMDCILTTKLNMSELRLPQKWFVLSSNVVDGFLLNALILFVEMRNFIKIDLRLAQVLFLVNF